MKLLVAYLISTTILGSGFYFAFSLLFVFSNQFLGGRTELAFLIPYVAAALILAPFFLILYYKDQKKH